MTDPDDRQREMESIAFEMDALQAQLNSLSREYAELEKMEAADGRIAA
jgi:prefoldin subunit 5